MSSDKINTEENTSTTQPVAPPEPTKPAKPISGPAAGAKKGGEKKEKKEKGDAKKKGKGEDDDVDYVRRRPDLIITEPVKGTRDFAPDEMRVRNWLFGHWRYENIKNIHKQSKEKIKVKIK